eukprot:1328609-Prymnesium_polylepis.1
MERLIGADTSDSVSTEKAEVTMQRALHKGGPEDVHKVELPRAYILADASKYGPGTLLLGAAREGHVSLPQRSKTKTRRSKARPKARPTLPTPSASETHTPLVRRTRHARP